MPADGPVSWTAREDEAEAAAVILASDGAYDGPPHREPDTALNDAGPVLNPLLSHRSATAVSPGHR